MWRLAWTSGYSYLSVETIRIDVYPTGDNPMHMTRTLLTPVHVCHTYAFYGQSTYVARDNILLAINSVGRTLLLLRKKAPDTILSTPADQSAGPPPSFSPKTNIEAVMKAKHMLTTSYIGLLGA
jgi:hypothetical protein